MKRLIILRGYPGSGKTTIGKILERDGLGKFIDHNSILNFITEITTDDNGIYEEINILEQAIARKLLNDNNTVIVGRGFSSRSNIQPYIELALKLGVGYNIITLKAPIEVLEKRVISPDRKNDFISAKSKKALRIWIESNAIDDIEGENIVNVVRPINDVIDQVKHLLEN